MPGIVIWYRYEHEYHFTVARPKLMPPGLGLVRPSGEELHEFAPTENPSVQTLIPSQPLLAHWFKRRLSLAQVSTSASQTAST
jgi:hypothetical protein